jgi:hypothetical protein
LILKKWKVGSDDIAEQDHWSEPGRATPVGNSDALDRPRRSVLSSGGDITRMTKRLQITLPRGWSDCSQDNEGAPTYIRDSSDDPGALQVSWAEYTSGKVPEPSPDDLVQMSRELGQSQSFGELIESDRGACDFGRLGTAVFRSQEQRIQIWHLSNVSVTRRTP